RDTAPPPARAPAPPPPRTPRRPPPGRGAGARAASPPPISPGEKKRAEPITLVMTSRVALRTPMARTSPASLCPEMADEASGLSLRVRTAAAGLLVAALLLLAIELDHVDAVGRPAAPMAAEEV